MEEASACQPYVKFFVSESLQDVAGGKHTPVTSPGALSTSVWLVMLVVCVCVCVWNTALCASVRAQTAFVFTGTLKSRCILHCRCSETFSFVVMERSCSHTGRWTASCR